ncbi:MAG: hypothetical protein RL344_492 [Pseudomonadota bacterium]|jgi:hypothetical protein
MNINKTIFSIGLLCTLPVVNAQKQRVLSTDYTINVYAKHIKNIKGNKQIKYDLDIINSSDKVVYGFIVGEASIADDEPAIITPSGDFSKIIFNNPNN